MSHACHRFWKCHKTLTSSWLLTRCTIPCACHTKRRFNVQKWSEPLVFLTFWLRNVLRATTACTFPTSQLPKVVRTRQFFDTFDLEMCFAPQRHALLRHRNFQKRSERDVFCTFWLRNVLRAPTACTFSTSQLPKVVRTWCVLYTACNFSFLIWPAGSAPAALASLLFDPPEPQIIGKTQWIATCLPFRALGSSFFWGFLFFDILSSSLLFSDSSRLCFSSFHIVGRLTSKLPSGSTAQGGGGSFKNRKPIGDVGCCEPRMAERRHWWTDRWLRSPLFLSLLFLWLSS